MGLIRLGRQIHYATNFTFFAYDAPKVLLLLVAVVFVIGILHSYFTAACARGESLAAARPSLRFGIGAGTRFAAELHAGT